MCCAWNLSYVQEYNLKRGRPAGCMTGGHSGRSEIQTKKRIGHEIRAIEDQALVEHLGNQSVSLEICPTSNVCTGNVRAIKDHPIRNLWDQGVPLTIDSDDPAMFSTTLNDEYRLLFQISLDLR